MKRYDVINSFIQSRSFQSFLEIGTSTGDTFRRIISPIRVSVDPDPKSMATFHMSSDEFFNLILNRPHTPPTFDIIFIDGLHEHNQVYRDVTNSLSILSPHGVILLHDCLPTTEHMQRNLPYYQGGEWTGDVWKAFVKLRTQLPYELYTINTDYGIGVIDTKLKKKSSTSKLPSDMETMTYQQFAQNQLKWMNVKEDICNA